MTRLTPDAHRVVEALDHLTALLTAAIDANTAATAKAGEDIVAAIDRLTAPQEPTLKAMFRVGR
jgi:hypothetical protein